MKRAPLFAFAGALVASFSVAGCGLREPLEPPPGQPAPPAPAMARGPLTTEQMLTPPPIARPERVDELLRRSEERQDDRFDLPPGDVPVPDAEDDDPE
ncbi:MAG TPA: hypothetical protein VFO69_10435 [Allosphingosinicella sp.]|nr:hypothetical protein [Allosphingosinicella sp.]